MTALIYKEDKKAKPKFGNQLAVRFKEFLRCRSNIQYTMIMMTISLHIIIQSFKTLLATFEKAEDIDYAADAALTLTPYALLVYTITIHASL